MFGAISVFFQGFGNPFSRAVFLIQCLILSLILLVWKERERKKERERPEEEEKEERKS